MSNSNGNVLTGALIGAGFGLLLLFRPVRIIFGLLMIGLALMFVQDKFSEEWVPGSDSSVYEMQIDSIVQSPASFDPLFDIDLSVKNLGNSYMQAIESTVTLYECSSEYSQMSECQPVAEKPLYMQINQRPGFMKHMRHRVMFNAKSKGGEHYLVQLNVDRISFDSDRTAL